MIRFILNAQTIETDLTPGTTLLDFVRYHKNLKGTKIGCREGDCGACTVLVGSLENDSLRYRTQTSCLMPLANARGRHVVTVEGINRPGELTPAQRALVDASGTQCGFCTVGFVISLTGFELADARPTAEAAVAAIDGNICRCTGYKSIERACAALAGDQPPLENQADRLAGAVARAVVPEYFAGIKERLENLQEKNPGRADRRPKSFVSGGTDLYVQRPEAMAQIEAENLFDRRDLRFIEETETHVEIGASTVVTDLLESAVFRRLFPRLERHLRLVSSTPIRNMASIAGNFVNASPIGDMTAWFLALDAEIELAGAADADRRALPLRDFFLGYKKLAKADGEMITRIRFRKDFTHFNFEKVSKRTYLDIASVNTAIGLKLTSDLRIERAHVSAGGVGPVPLYLRETSLFLTGREPSEAAFDEAARIMDGEISPISDVRGSAVYKRLLLRQLFKAHRAELFDAAG